MNTMGLGGKKVLVLGLGDTGLSAARWLARQGALLRVADTRSAPPHAATVRAELPDADVVLGPFQAELFAGVELIVASPGVPVADPAIADAAAGGIPVVGDVELFARTLAALGQGAPKVIAITGSNGKSTVTELAGAMCRAAGLKTVVAGNIGLPVLDALTDAQTQGQPDVYVLELSSFQLETTESLQAAGATVLNVTEDHLDRYSGMADYAAAKERILKSAATRVLNREDQWCRDMAQAAGGAVVTFGLDVPGATDYGLLQVDGAAWLAHGAQALLPVAELKIAGLHNAANALASLALCRALGLPLEPLLQALREFKGLPHRVEWVADVGGVAFFDDSKGTNVGATVAALTGMQQKLVLIAGGDGKGQDFGPLEAAVANRARAVVLIGRDGPRIADALSGADVPLVFAVTMDEAVREAYRLAKPGDAVLLSPACASLDMFRNYAHRAQVFIDAVRSLAPENDHAL